MIAINTFGYGLSEEVEPEIPSFSLLNRGRYSAEMVYNGTYDYQDIYDLQVGQSPNINFTFYDHWDTNHQWPLNLTVTELIDNLDTSNEGYYYNYYKATDGLNYDVRFRIVFKVGTPALVLREGGNYINYDYNGTWLDQLDSYTINNDISNITYDDSGNPINITNFKYEGTLYNHAELEWEGRILTYLKVFKFSGTSSYDKEIWYTYNDQGLRIQKVIEDSSGIIKYDYKLSGDLVILEIVSEYNDSTQIYDEVYKMLYSYDYDGTPIGFTYIDDLETTDYIYVKNLMGDINHITDLNGNIVVEYSYDAYGNITQVQGEKASTIGKFNSLRYRNYMYDEETAFYYLQSRYYNPEIGRFINADGLLGQVGNIQTHNMYAYCANNPVMYVDISGEFPILLFLASLVIGGVIGGVSSIMGRESDETILGAFVGGFVNGLVVTGAVTFGIALGGVPGLALSAFIGAAGGAGGSVLTDIISNKDINKKGMWLSAGYSAVISLSLAGGLMQAGLYEAGSFSARLALAATPDIIAIAAGVLIGQPIPVTQNISMYYPSFSILRLDYFGGLE